mmetsp:Transcript_73510/g.137360  ORF Transcript_73510/g.137360 Transcript_73510/m.137360 type:complete len:280 (+) Transcript_73510:70-909(+)
MRRICLVVLSVLSVLAVSDAAEGDASPALHASDVSAGLPGVRARASLLTSEQMHSANAVMKNHVMMIEDQMLAIKTTIKRLEAQLEEDKKLASALEAADAKVQEGRQTIVDGLTESQKKAHGDASIAFQKSIEGTDNTDQESVDESVKDTETDDTGTDNASVLELFAPGGNMAPSFMELQSTVNVAGSHWGDSEQVSFQPLEAKAAHIETTLDLLQRQLSKVRASKEHEELELKKSDSELTLYRAMLDAVEKQLDKLEDGRRSAMMQMVDGVPDYGDLM